jgi:hypothetical protein
MQKLAGLITEGSVDEAKASSLLAAKKKMSKKQLKEAIREMILNEISGDNLDEAKKKDKKEKDSEVEDINLDDVDSTGDEIDMNVDMDTKTITPQDVQKELTDALEAAKKLGDEKLVRQIGNALTYFTRSQIAGEENINETVESDELLKNFLEMTPEERAETMRLLQKPESTVSQKKINPNADKYKESSLARNEEFLQDVFRAPFVSEIRKMVTDYINDSNINDNSKKVILYNINTINNRDKLIKYITNSILAYEGLGVNPKKRFEE